MSITRKVFLLLLFALLVIACVGKDLRTNQLSQQEMIELKKEIFLKKMKEQCISVAGEEKGKKIFNTLNENFEDFKKCITDTIDQNEFRSDVTKYIGEQNISPLFHKYCEKRNTLLSCADTFRDKITDCYDKDEQEVQQIARRLLEAILNFVCENDGANVINFVKDNGSECIQNKMPEIQECAKTHFAELIPDNFDEENTQMPKLLLSEKECNAVINFKTCFIAELKQCEQKSAATFVETLLKHVKKEVDFCGKYEKN